MALPMRKPNRLKNYDYSQNGAYFIPVCAKERHEILWNVGATFGRPHESPQFPHESPQFSEYGKIIQNEIERIDEIFDHIAAGGRRATRGRPYSFAHYPAVQGFGSKTNRGFNLAGTVYPQDPPQLSEYGRISHSEK